MATVPPTPATGFSPEILSPSSQDLKPQRILACVLCQQRKVKCDRTFPCGNCTRSQVRCVQATLAPRRRRFSERALLERLRRYEELLQQNNVVFQPLDKYSSKGREARYAPRCGQIQSAGLARTERNSATTTAAEGFTATYKVKNVWHAMSQEFRGSDHDSNSSGDDVRETVITRAWDSHPNNDDNLLFGLSRPTIDASALHPDPVQIFRLWQIYLDNVDPLLKVTHTHSLQPRIIEAASNVANTPRTMQALMFSIYCIGIRSITTEECRSVFGSSKDQLLIEYQSGCRQALWASKFLQSDNRDCLTALFLYLLSLGRSTTPPSLHSMLGVAVRTAQRMGMHSETMLAKHTILEAEMRRRLWWAIVLFDTRISEFASSNIVTLDPTWDCRRPLNINNSELRAEMKTPLSMRGGSSEALFIAVRSEVADFIRHSDFHLDYTNPALKLISKHTQREVVAPNHDLNKLEEMLEEKYFQFCDLENPLHFTTIWTMRAYLAKYRLLEHHARQSGLPAHRTDAHREIATSYALKVLECDTKIMTSPLARGFRWLNMFHFPFPAYIQLLQGLARRPIDETACQAWEAISADYEGWFSADCDFDSDSPVYRMFSKFVLEAWEACEAASGQLKSALTPPRIVSFIRGTLARAEQDVADKDNDMAKIGTGIHNRSISAPVSTKSTSQGISGTTELQCDLPTMGAEVFFGNPGQHVLATELNQLDWSGLGEWPSWGLF